MKRAALFLLVTALSAHPLFAAQGHGRGNGKIPPGHLPPAGQCRAWLDGVPPGHQPGPTSCAEAERIAAREGGRVIYGGGKDKRKNKGSDRWSDDDRPYGTYDRRDRGDDRARDGGRQRPRDRRDTEGRAVPRLGGIFGGRTGETRGGVPSQSLAYDNGYRDGLVKGREDDDRNRSYDPARHEWYRSASRGYESRVGSRGEYSSAYRQGFTSGYDSAYRR